MEDREPRSRRRVWSSILNSQFFILNSLLLAGCSSASYSENLVYPLRTDALVVEPPPVEATEADPPGQVDVPAAKFNSLGGRAHDPAELTEDQRGRLHRALSEAFGTPAAPAVRGDAEADGLLARLRVEPGRLAEGGRLYKRNCLHCHGLTGDGRGPTGPWIQPRPRDFRQGVFKFVSSEGSAARKPARADLLRTIRTGVEGTSMPPFAMLAEDEQEAVVDYVIHLSLRGQVEYNLCKTVLAEGEEALDGNFASEVKELLKAGLKQWAKADAEVMRPVVPPEPGETELPGPEYLESVRRGYQLFVAPSGAGCISCHADFGRQAKFRYDAWGTLTRPADLTAGVFRGGKAPLDVYCRVRGGIGPSGMPAATLLREDQVWDLVRFVRALATPRLLPEDVRVKVYRPDPEEIAGTKP